MLASVTMVDPYAPPRTTDEAPGRRARAPRLWPDLLLSVILALVLLPAILINALVWYEHGRGIGIYDPARGGDPLWTHRPLLAPLLVGVVAGLRLALWRFWPLASRYRWTLLILAVVALLAAAASQIREPGFSYAP